jgi:molybdate transport system substrate-binding protein
METNNPAAAGTRLRCISSMATRLLLAELAQQFPAEVELVSIGGVDAARRVAAGEPFDVVVLASDALAQLGQAGHVRAGSEAAIALSDVAAAVAQGAPVPTIASQAELIAALRAARAIGYSTGPSGKALLALWQQWGLLEELQPRLVQAPPGVPVGDLLLQGTATLGFQQRSELIHHAGIRLLGQMPPGAGISTVFAAGICAAAPAPEQAAAFIAFLQSPAAVQALTPQGMAPPGAPALSPERLTAP